MPEQQITYDPLNVCDAVKQLRYTCAVHVRNIRLSWLSWWGQKSSDKNAGTERNQACKHIGALFPKLCLRGGPHRERHLGGQI